MFFRILCWLTLNLTERHTNNVLEKWYCNFCQEIIIKEIIVRRTYYITIFQKFACFRSRRKKGKLIKVHKSKLNT